MKAERKQKGIGLGTGMIIGIAIIYILFGLAMEFVPQFKEIYIIYIAGAIFVVFGIIMIVKYFLTGSYQDIGKYGFSAGVLCVLIGVLMLVRTNEIAAYFSLFLGICILLTAVIKLQNAVDLKSIHNAGWFVFLLIALAFLAVAILVILNPGGKVSRYKDVIYYLLIADGAIDLISPLYLVFAIRASRRVRPVEQRQKSDASDEKKENKDDSESEKQTSEHEKTEERSEDKKTAFRKKEQHSSTRKNTDIPKETGKNSDKPSEYTEKSQVSSRETAGDMQPEDDTDEMTKEILKFFEEDK